ncbi:glycosyltransferase family 2 protein [Nodularia chucula]|uniref:glycosyltransferase family 2 protein n=1 Tax=Nodularia chucula TaxID=3093667 RepID=UPI0039C60656
MISLVTTVLNDCEGSRSFFADMEAQTHLPNEIVIVDGGSRDGTWEFLQSYQPNKPYSLIVIQDAGCNVARGRNLAITQAKHDIIVSTDIGCKWEKEWLEELAKPLLENEQLESVMGSWAVKKEDINCNWAKVEYELLNQPKLIANPKSHASSRSIAYRKSLWKKIGGYPEDLTLAADDMVFALLLHSSTNQVGCAPISRCSWERPSRLTAFGKEAYRNFFGAGEAGIWLKYGLLVGGRLLLEFVLLIISLLAFLWFPFKWIGLIFLLFPAFSIFLRFIRLRPAIDRLKNDNFGYAWLKVLQFEYYVKFWGILGYWNGFILGTKKCHHCRERLRV